MENYPYKLNKVSDTFYSIILISQTPFYNEKSILLQLVLKKEIGPNINPPAFNVEILKYIVILLMYKKFGAFPI